jgi:hypothetical protein
MRTHNVRIHSTRILSMRIHTENLNLGGRYARHRHLRVSEK